MIKYFICVKHNVLKLDEGEGFLASFFRIYFDEFQVVKVAALLEATLDQRLSGGINPRSNGI